MSSLETEVELLDRDKLIPYTNNPKEHPDDQVQKIASSIKNYGWDQPIVIDGENEIIKGHGRMQAAELLDLDQVPVIRREDLTDAEARAARIADNKTAESAWDEELLSTELDVLSDLPEIDDESLGFDGDEIDELLDIESDDESDIEYTDKIKTPTYEPTQDEPPALDELYDTERYDELISVINEHDLPADLEQFLRFAAQRHIIFDYENIAEYFAHQDAETQELMELLTLVIVDYDQAIEQGFVNFADETLEGVGDA